MATPKGKRCKVITTSRKDQIHLYSDASEAVLQLRRSVATADDLTASSFKVGVVLTSDELLELAGEMLSVASQQLRSERKAER